MPGNAKGTKARAKGGDLGAKNPGTKPAATTDEGSSRILERPDGYYWASISGDKEYGPFQTLQAASEDMQYNEESDYEPGETLAEAESELGISDWIDPETGLPAEDGQSHIEDS
jgi:hypothetical protein